MDIKNGLVFSYILKGGKGQHIDWQEVKKWDPAQGILWLHLDYADEGVKKWLFEENGIDAVSCEALLAEETRPRTPFFLNILLFYYSCKIVKKQSSVIYF